MVAVRRARSASHLRRLDSWLWADARLPVRRAIFWAVTVALTVFLVVALT